MTPTLVACAVFWIGREREWLRMKYRKIHDCTRLLHTTDSVMSHHARSQTSSHDPMSKVDCTNK